MRRFPTSFAATAELVDLFRRHLELCKVKKGESVIVFTDPWMNQHYAAAAFGAALQLGADVFIMTVPSTIGGMDPTAGSHSAVLSGRTVTEAWKNADMVIGTASPAIQWLYSTAHNEALDAGTRTLMVFEPEDVLRRMFPCQEVKERSIRGAEVMTKAKTIRVTSDAGTDFVMDKTGIVGEAQYGIADVPGRWDHWPSGLVACNVIAGSAEGTLVLGVGDITFRLGRYFTDPVKLTLRGGKIVKIEGRADAILLEDYFKSARDPRAYCGPAHIGWGTDHRAQYFSLAMKYREHGGHMDSESFMGNVQTAFGRDIFRGLGGTNDVNFHIDFPCRNCNFYLDDKLIVKNGVIVDERCK
jgi:2,5-dihydroxypyridine 5,6-dioxygenase